MSKRLKQQKETKSDKEYETFKHCPLNVSKRRELCLIFHLIKELYM